MSKLLTFHYIGHRLTMVLEGSIRRSNQERRPIFLKLYCVWKIGVGEERSLSSACLEVYLLKLPQVCET